MGGAGKAKQQRDLSTAKPSLFFLSRLVMVAARRRAALELRRLLLDQKGLVVPGRQGAGARAAKLRSRLSRGAGGNKTYLAAEAAASQLRSA